MITGKADTLLTTSTMQETSGVPTGHPGMEVEKLYGIRDIYVSGWKCFNGREELPAQEPYL